MRYALATVGFYGAATVGWLLSIFAVCVAAVLVGLLFLIGFLRPVNRRERMRWQVSDAERRVDTVFRNAQRAMDDISGMSERRPFGDWRDIL